MDNDAPDRGIIPEQLAGLAIVIFNTGISSVSDMSVVVACALGDETNRIVDIRAASSVNGARMFIIETIDSLRGGL